MQLNKTNPSTSGDTWISAEESAILGRFAERANRADDVATEDTGSYMAFVMFMIF